MHDEISADYNRKLVFKEEDDSEVGNKEKISYYCDFVRGHGQTV